MMGLSWECEPALREVEHRYGENVEFRDVMGLLVRDVADFMAPEELALPEAEGITHYNARLAQVYLDEQSIGGVPINMDGFCLFAPDRRSSLPLCLAFEALCADLRYKESLGIYALPAFLVSCDEDAVLIRGVVDYETLDRAIQMVSDAS